MSILSENNPVLIQLLPSHCKEKVSEDLCNHETISDIFIIATLSSADISKDKHIHIYPIYSLSK